MVGTLRELCLAKCAQSYRAFAPNVHRLPTELLDEIFREMHHIAALRVAELSAARVLMRYLTQASCLDILLEFAKSSYAEYGKGTVLVRFNDLAAINTCINNVKDNPAGVALQLEYHIVKAELEYNTENECVIEIHVNDGATKFTLIGCCVNQCKTSNAYSTRNVRSKMYQNARK